MSTHIFIVMGGGITTPQQVSEQFLSK